MRVVPFDVPGHKRGRGNPELTKFLGERCISIDVNSMKPLDNLCHPTLAPFLAGTEASGLFEARLGREEFSDGEVHVFCGAYRESEFAEVLTYADHIVFNSPTQLKRFGAKAKADGKSIGLRINPQHSTQDGHDIYDPCAPGSRLGTTRERFVKYLLMFMDDFLKIEQQKTANPF